MVATLDLPPDVGTFLARHGHPIRYRHVPQPWPLSAYQTVFSTEPGSAEMPSAGRPFTNELVTRLVTAGRGRRPSRAPHGRLVTRGPRGSLSRALPGAAHHRRRRERHAAGRPSRGRRRHHRGAGARDGGPPQRPGHRGHRLDRPRPRPRATGSGGRRPGDRLARAPVVTPPAAGVDRTGRRRWRRPTARPWRSGTGGTSSATSTCCCREGTARPRRSSVLKKTWKVASAAGVDAEPRGAGRSRRGGRRSWRRTSGA